MNVSMRFLSATLFLCALMSVAHAQNKPRLLEKGFLSTPDSIRTGVIWYWVSDNISKEGAVADLQAIKRAGFNMATIGFIGPSTHHNQNYPYGKIKFMSKEWWEVIHTALKTATDLDIEIGIFNSAGWSQSGGPWVKPEQAMRYLASTEIQVKGGKKISEKILPPTKDFQDVKTIAFKANRKNLFDSSNINMAVFDSVPLTISFPEENTVRGIIVYPSNYLNAKCEVQVKDGNGYRTLKEFAMDRDAFADIQRGYDQRSPIAESLPETTGKEFRLVFKNAKEKSVISSLFITPSPIVEHFPEKIYAKFGSFGSTPASLADKSLFVNPDEVLDISEHLAVDGTLNWTVPEGNWVIMRLGMTPTNTKNSPASPEATGLETDKLSSEYITAHFNAFLGEIIKRVPAADRKCWKYTVLDSWEKGSQNITDDMLKKFEQRYGYDPTPFLPTYYGYPVGNYELTERFMWDLHRFIADAMAYEYVGGLREVSHKYGLKTWLENYGHAGFSGEMLQYGGQSDEVAGEFWSSRHVMEKRAAASCAHTYGKPRVWAESFTNGGKEGSAYQRYPTMLKPYGDLAFATGTNSMLLHVYIQQYVNDEYPGVDAWFGTEFNRKNTWFSQIDMFVEYIKRSSFLLQQGVSVADVAYYIGEDVPIMSGSMNPALPKGYYFDFVNSEILINKLDVKNGRLILPHGVSYSVLVLPPKKTMRPAVLEKIGKLIANGATIIGPLPECSPSLQNYPQCDAEVQKKAAELKGKTITNKTLEEVFASLNIPPDFELDSDASVLYQHRTVKEEGVEIYFLTNQSSQVVQINPQFRVTGMQPELWNAVTGTIRSLPDFEQNGITTKVPLQLDSNESVFIVFRNKAKSFASGSKSNFSIPKVALNVNTPWKVRFESDSIRRGPAEVVTFSQLSDWSQNDDIRIKYFSGTAHYETKVKLQNIPTGKIYLDLGEVSVMGKVKVNGKDVGGVWTTPYHVNITGAIKKGENTIEVEVVNTWLNRMLGDRKLLESERKLTPHTAPWKASTPLQKSGLLGPVRLVSVAL